MITAVINLVTLGWRLIYYLGSALYAGTPVKKLRTNFFLAVEDQLPLARLWRNARLGYILGLASKWSHMRKDGVIKVMYNTKTTAQKSAVAMSKKQGVHFSNYKCIWCDGYHIGKHTPVNNFENL